ncbi:hypothetical protein [Halonatronum saccharophilum]|uniref:hypothetical protein n=1 Tax=Halonatronum saccharophilum TaxID=150060 RepID=UPI000482CCB7|nr:hypothetical protein [Halonatronum saccharophilum]
MLVINEYEDLRVSDCEIENRFILLGSLVVRNYSQIILKYEDELNSEIKSLLTLLINNLLLCTQLQSRIFNLKEGIMSLAEEEKGLFYLDETMKEIKDDKIRLERSLAFKEERLKDLSEENIDLLTKLGRLFYQEKWLKDRMEFKELYNKLDSFFDDKGQARELDNISNHRSDVRGEAIYSLLKPYPSFLL